MSGNGNGSMKMFTFVGSIIGGSIGVIAIIYTTVYNPLNTAVAQEAQARETAVKETLEVHRQDIKDICANQQTINLKILDKLTEIDKKQTEISTDLKYVKSGVLNGTSSRNTR